MSIEIDDYEVAEEHGYSPPVKAIGGSVFPNGEIKLISGDHDALEKNAVTLLTAVLSHEEIHLCIEEIEDWETSGRYDRLLSSMGYPDLYCYLHDIDPEEL